jgi:hypothetical protein
MRSAARFCAIAIAAVACALTPMGTSLARADAATSSEIARPDPRFGVAEGYRNPVVMSAVGAGWERIVLTWTDLQPERPGDFTHLGRTFPANALAGEISRGVTVAAVLQATPAWAQLHPEHGIASAPRNLDLPFDDPQNYWAEFVYQTVRYYSPQIHEWILWNEPDFRPGDAQAGDGVTWRGSEREFARLLSVGYLAAKRADPTAVVAFPAMSYWIDALNRPGQPLFYERLLQILAGDALASSNGFYHDAVGLNLYDNPEAVYSLYAVFKAVQRRHGLDKPIWLTEMNTFPPEASSTACGDSGSPSKVTQNQQAAYAVQTLALATAAGFARMQFFQMQDGDDCRGQTWGLLRVDGSARPVLIALRTAIGALSGFASARLVPVPPDGSAYMVVIDKPGNVRVTVMWNRLTSPLQVRIGRTGSSGRVLDLLGNGQPARGSGNQWLIDLPERQASLSEAISGEAIGGAPLLMVEEGAMASAPVASPRVIRGWPPPSSLIFR